MRKFPRSSIVIVSILLLLTGLIYLISSYVENLGASSSDTGSQIQTIFFAMAGIVYVLLGIWMLKNRLHSRGPYVISILVSAFMIILYVISRNISLPVVGIQTDVGIVDLSTKAIQVGIIVYSVMLLRYIKKYPILSDSQLPSNKSDWEKQNVS